MASTVNSDLRAFQRESDGWRWQTGEAQKLNGIWAKPTLGAGKTANFSFPSESKPESTRQTSAQIRRSRHFSARTRTPCQHRRSISSSSGRRRPSTSPLAPPLLRRKLVRLRSGSGFHSLLLPRRSPASSSPLSASSLIFSFAEDLALPSHPPELSGVHPEISDHALLLSPRAVGYNVLRFCIFRPASYGLV